MVGRNLQAEIGGFGPTLAAALRDLAENIEKDERISMWVPQRVPYREDRPAYLEQRVQLFIEFSLGRGIRLA